MNYDNSNKVVIVTGGAKGIGRGISLAFGAAGATVVSADVDEAAGADLTAVAADLDGSVHFVAIDVSTADGCRSLVDTTTDIGGRVDVVCNNVGIQPMSSYVRAHELPEEDWDRILAVNLKSAFLMAKYAIPHMQAQGGGVIINTASVQGLQSAPMVSAYAASKGGLLSLTQQLSLDYAVDNIRVLSVNPGTIDTPLVAEAAAASVRPGVTSLQDLRDSWAEDHPIGRIGQPEDIARVVLFLASDDASFMTGSWVNVDGGMMAKGAWA